MSGAICFNLHPVILNAVKNLTKFVPVSKRKFTCDFQRTPPIKL